MLHYETKDLTIPEIQRLLQGGVAPRPIALVSTLSEDGVPNLTPFSFFNVFGANPPVLAFSASRRGRDGTLKDSFNNIMYSKECVVQAVTFPMVEQISLASTEYPSDINEFIKSGLTPIPSDLVKPFRVKESPFQMECKLLHMIPVGDGGASANIAICEVIKFHISEDIFRNGVIYPDLIDLVARMGGDFYSRASGSSLFEVEKPIAKKGIGYDNLPDYFKTSDIYSANNLGKFGNIEKIPDDNDVIEFIKSINEEKFENFEPTEEAFYRFQKNNDYRKMYKAALFLIPQNHHKGKIFVELTAKCALENNNIPFAWKAALSAIKLGVIQEQF